MAKQIMIKRQPRKPREDQIDTRTPSGKPLPY